MKNYIFVLALAFFSQFLLCSDSSTEEIITEPALFYQVGVHSQKNNRTGRYAHANEDRYVFQSIKYAFDVPDRSAAVFGVFDGHGTANVSDFLKENFVKTFLGAAYNNENISQAIKNTFMSVDMQARILRAKQGSTAVVAIIHDQTIYLANAGDSAAIAILRRENQYYYMDTTDHKPNVDSEMERILQAGGTINYTGPVARVGGNLSVSRSIGDYPKEIGLIATPEVKSTKIDESFQALILVSDGVTDKLSREEIMNIVLDAFYEGKSAEDAARMIVAKAALRGSTDDITALVIRFLWENRRPAEATVLDAPFSSCNVKRAAKINHEEKIEIKHNTKTFVENKNGGKPSPKIKKEKIIPTNNAKRKRQDDKTTPRKRQRNNSKRPVN